MTSVGWSTLDVIPSVKNLRSELERQTRSDFTAAGKRGGQQYGDAAGREAGTRFTGRLRASLRTVAAPLAGIAAGLGGARIFGDMIAEAQEAVKVTKVTEQLVRTTGGAANLTAAQIGNLASKLSDYAAVDDELVQSGENVLLTFRNVRNELGQGNDIFNRATKAALDMSTVLGSDLNGAVLQLGKALNDPIKGVTALGRAGVQFSADQKAQIKAFVENNDLLSAQKLVLDELEKQVGGAAGANATALDRLQVSFKNLEESAGTALAPALDKLATVAAKDVIPALQGVGGVVGDAARGFNDLPTPIKAAAGAFVALRLAAAAGIGTSIAAGVTSLSSAFVGLRLRAMLAADAFRAAQGSGLAATLAGIRAGAAGAATALRAVGTAVLPIAAIAGAVTIWSKFSQGQAEAKQRVQELTDSLDKQTGAITDNTREAAFKALRDSGAIDAAKQLGIGLGTLTSAALGNKAAMAQVNSVLEENQSAVVAAAGAQDRASGAVSSALKPMQTIRDVLGGQNSELEQAKTAWRDHTEAMGDSAKASGTASRAMGAYTTQIDGARDAVQKLLDKENERRNKNLGAFQDQTRLAQALADANKEAKEGKKTLDAGTEAGRKNRDALAGLADAWNSAADKVKNAKGAYADMRQNFIDVAEKMGASETQAKKLADQLLGIPPKTPAQVTTPGMDAALDKVKELNRLLRNAQKQSRIVITAQAGKNFPAVLDAQAHADGGLLRGPGTGTSDSILMWGSNGEFMQRKRAVDYYGVDFMRRLNNLQVPRYAGGGQVGAASTGSPTPLGTEVMGTLRIVGDAAEITGVARAVDAAEARRTRARRAVPIGGIPQ